jgi:hypothetical protein
MFTLHIISPNPLLPPVTTATRPWTLNRLRQFSCTIVYISATEDLEKNENVKKLYMYCLLLFSLMYLQIEKVDCGDVGRTDKSLYTMNYMVAYV